MASSVGSAQAKPIRLRAVLLPLVTYGLAFVLACGGATRAAEISSGTDDASPDATVAGDAEPSADGGEDNDGGASLDAASDATAFDGGVTCAALPPPVQLPPSASASGTRLTLRTLAEAAPLGVEIAEDVFDTSLGKRCFPLRYTDGTIRCVPELAISPPLFGDAALTQPIALVPLSPSPAAGDLYLTMPGYTPAGYNPLATASPFDCAGAVHVDALGPQRSVPTYYDAKGVAHSANTNFFALYDLVAAVPDLVTLQEIETRLAGDIAVRELHGADGSRLFPQYLYDTRHGVAVSVRANRCLPPSAAAVGHLSPPPTGTATESWCKAPDPIFLLGAVSINGKGCSSPTFVNDGAQTFAVTQQTRTFYRCDYNMEGKLSGFTSSTVPLLISCGAVPFTDWTAAPPLTLGGARLTTKAVAIGGVVFAPPLVTYGQRRVLNVQRETEIYGRTFFDNVLGISCAAAPSSEDGLTHCFPTSALRAAYSDAACTQPIAAGDQVPASQYAMEAAGSYGIAHVFSVGPPLGQMHAFYTPDAFSSCSYVDYGNAQPFYAFAATPVPVATFAELKLRSAQ